MTEIAVDFRLGPDLSSRIVSFWGEGYGGYSHSASLLASGIYLDSRSDVVAGVPPGVQLRHPDSEPWIRRRRATLAVSTEDYWKWEGRLRSHLNDAYDPASIWAFITGRNTPGTKGHWICSALVLDGLQALDLIPTDFPVPLHQVTPNALLLVLAALGFTIGPEVWAK